MVNATGTKIMVTVKSHKRRSKKGKLYKVSSHNRINKRPLGKKLRYKDVGRFQAAFDEYGNLRGSRIIKNPEALKKNSTASSVIVAEIRKIDTQFSKGELSYEEYVKKLNNLLGTS